MKEKEIRIIDIYYNKSDESKAKERGQQLISEGYQLNAEDSGTDEYEFCDQYIKTT